MTTIEIVLVVVNLLLVGPVAWLLTVLTGMSKRLSFVEHKKVDTEQMKEYVELKQEPIMVMIRQMADDLHRMRRLMEEQAHGKASEKE